MEPIKIAFAGAGGYADYCLSLLINHIPPEEYQLVGIADPYADRAPRYQYFLEHNIPLYDSAEELFAKQQVDALYIASPIPYHKQQCETAIAHGCAILCEKPLTALLEDTLSLRSTWTHHKMPFGIGFQWSYAPSMLRAKRDILSNVYGGPKEFKALISWQRYDDYYSTSPWKGRIVDTQGNIVRDSVVTNATAHYLHNIFFMMGEAMESSLMPARAWGSVYRAKPIESFDTCFFKGSFANGASFLFLSTHSGDEGINPVVEYAFEKGVIRIDTNTKTPTVRGYLEGKEIDYGEISTPESDSHKLKTFFASIRDGSPLPCPIDAVLPHQAVCGAAFDQLSIKEFPKSLVYRSSRPDGWFVHGLCRDLKNCFDSSRTPYEAGCAWAVKDTVLDLSGLSVPVI